MRSILNAAAFAAVAACASAQTSPTVVRACPSTGLCFGLSIPSSTAQSGSGSIYFQMQAPTTNAWAALGQGSRMAGSNIFVMYQNAAGTNITVSARKASGHVMPTYDSSVQISLLAGSGISDGVMTANVRCDTCSSWSGGSLDYSADSSSWIWAVDAGTAIKSDSQSVSISRHDSYGNFDFATRQAIGAASANPFVTNAAADTLGSSAATGSAVNSTVVSNPTSGSYGYTTSSYSSRGQLLMAHAILATVAFVALFPLGALLMRVGRMGRQRLWIHGGIQLLAYLVFIAGAGIGIYIARGSGQLTQAHPIIGLFLLGFVFFMPFAGYYHHVLFKRSGRPTAVGRAHSYSGRIAILLGIVNGGLGLQLAGAAGAAVIAYGVVAGLIGIAYLATIVWWEVSGSKRTKAAVVEKGSPRRSHSGA